MPQLLSAVQLQELGGRRKKKGFVVNYEYANMVRNKAARMAEIITLWAALPFWTGDNEIFFAMQKSLLAEQRQRESKLELQKATAPLPVLANRARLS